MSDWPAFGRWPLPSARQARRFFGLLFGQCLRDECTRVAASLAYATTLGLVPVLALVLSLFQWLPVFPDWLGLLQDWIHRVFNPHLGPAIENYLLIFANKARSLTVFSVAAFFVTSLLLLNSIDRALNRIWHVRRHRGFWLTLGIYILILVFGPLLLGLSLSLTTWLLTLPYLSQALAVTGLKSLLLSLLPILSSAGLFAMVYRTVPNVPVRWAHALIAGTIAALLFELAKHLFAMYLRWFPTYELIYGALATIPLLLVWIYVSWLITLFGAEIGYALGVGLKEQTRPRDRLLMLARLLAELYRHPAGLSLRELERRGDWSGPGVLDLLLTLRQWGLVIRYGLSRWRLAGGLDELTLYDLVELAGGRIPLQAEGCDAAERAVLAALADARSAIGALRSIRLMPLLASAASRPVDNLKDTA